MRFAKIIGTIKNDILGRDYSLSIAFVDETKSREINKTYRHKDTPTNILSFPLRKNLGELVLCKAVIKKEAKNSGKTFGKFLIFLIIHGMLHLRGMKHGGKMEKEEKKYLSRTKFYIK